MQPMERTIQDLKVRLKALAPADSPEFEPALTRPPNAEMGDMAVAAFPLAKAAGKPPQEVARAWAERIPPGTELAPGLIATEARPAGGFLNLRFDGAALMRAVCEAVASEGASYGKLSQGAGIRAMVEYSSPNTNKPLHLGHVRNNVIGMSLSNLLEAAGFEVIRANLVNDRGIHICKSMLAYASWGEAETPQSTGEKGDHFVGRYYVRYDGALREERAEFYQRQGIDPAQLDREAADQAEQQFLAWSPLQRQAQKMLQRWEDGDPEVRALWERMNGWVYEGFRETYARLGCRFDRWYFESETWTRGKSEVDRGIDLGVFYRKEDGSVWARLEPVGLQDKLLLRSDGTSVYITQDIGTAMVKHADFEMERSLYVVGAEQVLHFKNLFAILKLLGHPWAGGCHHVAYGLVTLPRGMGRLKSREGTAVDADDLLDMLRDEARRRIVEGGYCGDDPERVEATAEAIGQGALKAYLLQVGNDKNIVFDPEEKLAFEGDTGPAIQYSHARICGIVRKGLERGVLRVEELSPAKDAPGGVFVGLRENPGDLGRLDSPEERDLALRLLEFPLVVALSARQLSAAPVANYLLELTRSYARFYHQHRVLEAPDAALMRARLSLSLAVAQVLRRGLSILTITAPDRM